MSEYTNQKKLPDQLADEIISYICKYDLGPGSRLPNESILAQKLGAGRSSIREAIKLLISRNIVTSRQGAGTYVTEMPGIVEDPLGLTFLKNKQKMMVDLLEIRLLIEPPLASEAARSAGDDDLIKLQFLYAEIQQLFAEQKNWCKKLSDFHTAVSAAGQNLVAPRLTSVISRYTSLFVEMTGNALERETLAYCRTMVDALARHDEKAAHDASYLYLIQHRMALSDC